MFVELSHVRPSAALHAAAVMRRGSQVTPAIVPSAMQVPLIVIVEPTHERPAPHGIVFEHEPEAVAGATQIIAELQTSVGPQPCAAHESPAAGMVAHTPHNALGAIAQNVDAHCAANSQATPFAAGPAGGKHAVGSATPDSAASHVCVASALEHASIVDGDAADAGAARASAQATFSRVSQVARSGHRFCRSADEHVISCVHRVVATSLQALSVVRSVPHAPTMNNTTGNKRSIASSTPRQIHG